MHAQGNSASTRSASPALGNAAQQTSDRSPVLHMQPDEIKGTVPVAFVVPRLGHADSAQSRSALAQAVVDVVGAIAGPARVVVVPTVPRTRTGTIVRRVPRDLLVTGQPTGDSTTLESPDASEIVRSKLRELP